QHARHAGYRQRSQDCEEQLQRFSHAGTLEDRAARLLRTCAPAGLPPLRACCSGEDGRRAAPPLHCGHLLVGRIARSAATANTAPTTRYVGTRHAVHCPERALSKRLNVAGHVNALKYGKADVVNSKRNLVAKWKDGLIPSFRIVSFIGRCASRAS